MGNDVILGIHPVDLVVVVVGPDIEAHHPALKTVAQAGMDQLLGVFRDGFLPGQPLIARFERKTAAAESAGDLRPGPERRLAGFLIIAGPVGVVEEHPAAQRDFEIRAAEVLKIVPETHGDTRIAVIVPVARPELPVESGGGIDPVTVVHPVVVVKIALENMLPEVFARGGPDAVEHPRRGVLHAEIVPYLGILPLVVDIPHDIARRGILRRGVEIQHRVERIPRAGLHIERQRTVELPVSHRRRTDRARRERRAQRQRRDGIVDLGTHARRVGHIGLYGQFRGALHLRNIRLGHLDLLLDLRRSQLRQNRCEQRGYKDSLHRQLSFAIRAFASSTMPSSAGE